MSEKLLSIFLISFAILFLLIILGWATFKMIFSFNNPDHTRASLQYNRLKGVHILYRIILIAFAVVSMLYFIYPKSQDWLGPIHWLNNDYINITGLIVLLIAFILVIYNQFLLDKSLHNYYIDVSKQSVSSLVPKTERNLLKSILLVYVGLFIVVSTVATGILLLVSFVVYYLRSSNRQYRIKTPLPSKQQPSL